MVGSDRVVVQSESITRDKLALVLALGLQCSSLEMVLPALLPCPFLPHHLRTERTSQRVGNSDPYALSLWGLRTELFLLGLRLHCLLY